MTAGALVESQLTLGRSWRLGVLVHERGGVEECLQGPAPPAQLPALWTRLLVICTFSFKGRAELGVLRDPAQRRGSVCTASGEGGGQ